MPPDKTDFGSDILQAWNGQMDLVSLIEAAARWDAKGLGALAAVLYQTWLARNDTPHKHFAHFNHGAALFHAGDIEAARCAYLSAIERAPDFIQPHFNLGLVYERLQRPLDAVVEWQWVVAHASPDQAEERALRQLALNNMGRLQEQIHLYGDALESLRMSLEMDSTQRDVLHHWVFLRAKLCSWPVYGPVARVDPSLLRASTSALAMIALADDPQAQLDAARRYVDDKVEKNLSPLAQGNAYGHRKLRIGYLSSDFCLHPVALLTAELFELHDRTRVEVYGYCWSREDNSDLRRRIIASMDHFTRIGDLTDEAAAQRIRTDEIDVLVDLHGQTLGARPNILARRPAPVQVTYLGLPATTGLPCVDYVIADKFLIPEAERPFYSEQPLYMPHTYQVSDRKRACAPVPTRASCGLPQDAFVFCSFNNSYKFTPEMFAAWMRILQRVPGSLLWLLADNPWSQENLLREAQSHGIARERIHFAPRLAPENYLARFGVPDLFLDSYPFNAGTTANDALWMGLPVLTLTGRCFAARMAGALLTSAGLEELITYDLHDYEEKAVALAADQPARERIRGRLAQVRADGALFDTARFARDLEDRFGALVQSLPARLPA